MKKLYYLLIAILFVSFASCSDDDHGITIHYMHGMMMENEPAANQIDISVVYGASYQIKGGKAPYTVEVSDESLILAETDELLSVYGHKPGVGSLIITDDAGKSKTYKVTVSERNGFIRIAKLETNVVGGNIPHTGSVTVNESVVSEISEGFIITDQEMFDLTYKTKNSGDLTICKQTQRETVVRRGVFEIDFATGLFDITFADNQKVNLVIDFRRPSPVYQQRDIEPRIYYMVEDLTKKYQEKYPTAGLTKVERLYFSIMNL